MHLTSVCVNRSLTRQVTRIPFGFARLISPNPIQRNFKNREQGILRTALSEREFAIPHSRCGLGSSQMRNFKTDATCYDRYLPVHPF